CCSSSSSSLPSVSPSSSFCAPAPYRRPGGQVTSGRRRSCSLRRGRTGSLISPSRLIKAPFLLRGARRPPPPCRAALTALSPVCSARGARGHLQRLRVLLLRPVAQPHPVQQRRDHPLLQDAAAQRPHAAHRQVGRLRQPGAEERRRVAGHQPGLRRLRGPGGARQRQVQRQRLARCEGHPQPETGKGGAGGG
ncbi:unnamed protein product, partial [Tetraodon nigroviridis]